jgi:predicted dehydrogenase
MTKDDRPDASSTPSGVTRREFVATVAGAGAAFMIVPRHVLGRGFQPPSDIVNVAAVGINGMGAVNTRAVMSQNVVAICDCDFALLDGKLAQWTRQAQAPPRPPNDGPPSPPPGGQAAADKWRTLGPSKAQAAADARWPAEDPNATLRDFVDRQLPRLQKYRDYREMLEKQKDIDAVIVATPDHMHAVIASNAMDLGKHVYVQKPLCWSVHEARHLLKKAADKKVVTQMGNQRHSLDDQRRGVEYIQGGAIGDVREVHVWTNRPFGYWPQGVPRPAPLSGDPSRIGWDNRGLTQRIAAAMKGNYPVPDTLSWDLFLGVAPDVEYHPLYHPFNWRGWVDWGQGALGDMGAHLIDFPMWSLQLGLPVPIESEAGLVRRRPDAARSTGARGGQAQSRRRHPVCRQEGEAAAGELRAAAAAAGFAAQLVRRAQGAARAHPARGPRDELDPRDQRQGSDLVPVRVRGTADRDDAARRRGAARQLEAALRHREHARHEQRSGEPVPDPRVQEGIRALVINP